MSSNERKFMQEQTLKIFKWLFIFLSTCSWPMQQYKNNNRTKLQSLSHHGTGVDCTNDPVLKQV